MKAEFAKILAELARGEVEFILIGGLAATLHGSARFTYDVDVVYHRSLENLDRVVATLGPFHPYLRGAPAGLPFVWDARTLRHGLNFTFTTDLGDLDLLGEVPGGRDYPELLPHSTKMELADGTMFYCVDLDRLIVMKNASGRTKDFEILAELRALDEEARAKARRDSAAAAATSDDTPGGRA